MSEPKVYIYWDNSNIFISAKIVAREKDGPYGENSVRIQFDNLFKLASANRVVANACCVGSVPPELKEVWERIRQTGVNVETYERGKDSGKEQGLDQCLQVHMLRALTDNKEPQIAVLLTGDGQGYDDGVGFHADLERMQRAGWGIEVIAWDRSCRKTLSDWASRVGSYIKLEDHYSSVTFLKELRASSPLNLTHRPKSKPIIIEKKQEVDTKKEEADKEKERRKQKYLKKQKRATELANQRKKHRRR